MNVVNMLASTVPSLSTSVSPEAWERRAVDLALASRATRGGVMRWDDVEYAGHPRDPRTGVMCRDLWHYRVRSYSHPGLRYAVVIDARQRTIRCECPAHTVGHTPCRHCGEAIRLFHGMTFPTIYLERVLLRPAWLH